MRPSADIGFLTVTIITLIAKIQGRVTKYKGGFFTKTQDPNFYGNDVELRSYYFPTGGRKTWIDQRTSLPAASIKRLFYYVHNIPGRTDEITLRIQIWRHLNNTSYQLVWEVSMPADLNSNGGYYYEIDLESHQIFETEQGDMIGWTSEDSLCPLSCKSPAAGHATLRRGVGNAYPVLGDTYSFTDAPVDAIFSIGMEAKPFPTQPTKLTTEGSTAHTDTSTADYSTNTAAGHTSSWEPANTGRHGGGGLSIRDHPAYVTLIGMSIIILLMFTVAIASICTLSKNNYTKVKKTKYKDWA